MGEDKQKEAFAIRWRDRYIRELTDALAGREQEAELLAALLKCVVVRSAAGEAENDAAAETAGAGGVVLVGKAELAAALGRYRATVAEEPDAYRVAIEPLGALADGDA